MSEELKALRSVIDRLNRLKIPYMLTGSVAMQYYVTIRMTRDVDVVLQISERDVSRVVQEFRRDFYIDEVSVRDAITHKSLFNILDNASLTKLDLIIKKDTPYRNHEFERRKKVMLGNLETWIVSPEDLIISKLDWAKSSLSEQQFRDVRSLLTTPKLDMSYIEKWVSELGLKEVFEKAIK